MKANEIKKGLVIEQDGKKILVKQVIVQSPSSRSGSTLYKVSGSDISSGQKFERRYKGDEVITPLDVSRRSVQLLFHDTDSYTFMDSENYEQFVLPAEALQDEALFLYDGLEGLSALIAEGQLLGIELPNTMALEITECAPAMKAASSSARTKPATLTTGLVVQVPEYLTPGETIRVNTETRDFISRA
ncbi:MAG TPA: elongation factor P-like protein YeiP [Gammaproteobacteria bacterium]|nr:elongation factor P-like protein YeiP [Gammaproteobacteria bacterium]